MLFPDLNGKVIILIGILLICSIVGAIVFIDKTTQPTKEELSIQQNEFEKLLKRFNVPQVYYKAVIHDNYTYKLYYAPVVMWRNKDIIKMLVIGGNSFIIETPVERFREVIVIKFTEFSAPTHKEDNWYALPGYIKNTFVMYMNHYNIYDARNRPLTYGTYLSGGFAFCTNSLHSLFSAIGEPSSFYVFDILAKDFLKSKVPKHLSNKEEKLKKILNENSYAKVQNQLFEMVNDNELDRDEAIKHLNNNISGYAKCQSYVTDDKNSIKLHEKNITKGKLYNRKNILIVSSFLVIVAFGLIFYTTTDFSQYKKAIKLYNAEKYKEAYNKFCDLDGYKDSNKWMDKTNYQIAMQYKKSRKYEKAIEYLETIFTYKDSSTQIKDCKYEIAKMQLKENTTQDTYYIFMGLKDYKDSTNLAFQAKEKVKEDLYNDAITKYNSGDFDRALLIFNEIDGYKETRQYVEYCNIMNKFQGVFDSTIAKNNFIVLDGKDLYEYDTNHYNTGRTSRDYTRIELTVYKGQYYLTNCYENPENSFVLYALIETDDNSMKGIDVIYPTANYDFLYTFTTEITQETLETAYGVEEYKEKSTPYIGMTIAELKDSTWGEPQTINEVINRYGINEQWVYENGDYIYLQDGRVTEIQD